MSDDPQESQRSEAAHLAPWIAAILAIPAALIATAALETLLLPAETYERSDVELLQVFVLGVKTGSEVLWAPLIYQLVVAALLALARPKSWLRWVAVGTIAAAAALLVYHLYGVLTSYPPFRGRFLFVAAYTSLFLFLGWWAFELTRPTEPASRSRSTTAMRWATPALALIGSALVYLLNSTLYPDAYLELHYSAAQVSFVLLHAGLTGTATRSRSVARLPRGAQLAGVFVLGGVLAAGLLLAAPDSWDATRSAFRRFTTLGQALVYDRPKPFSSGGQGPEVPDDPHGVERFARHSGLPPLPSGFALGSHNVLLISIETLRYRDTSLGDPARDTTPHLFELAKNECHWFTRAYSPAPYTLQTFSAMFAMTYPSSTQLVLGYNSWDGVLPPKARLVPEILRENGYSTFWVGHNHDNLFGKLVTGLEQGFDAVRFADTDDPEADIEIVTGAIDAIERRRRKNRPFFGWVFLESPHHDYVAHYDHLPKETERDRYRQEVRFADEQLGVLVAHLKKNGLTNKTVIIVHGDHGEEFGEHGKSRHSSLYSEVTHVPLIVCVPGSRPQKHHAPVSLGYLFPWLLRHGPPSARRAAKRSMTHSFGPMMRRTENAVVIERLHRHHPRVSLVYPHWRAIFDIASRYFELYDLRADPHEQHNIFDPKEAKSRRFMHQVKGYMEMATDRRRFEFARF